MSDRAVLILGAGINGAALARELVLNKVPVTIVDTGDISRGASAYSSRLIHGGLRYLEYGEFDLVRESLAERNRLLTLAPQFVEPLRLYIPVANRFSGAITQATRFLGLPGGRSPRGGRGLYVVRAGLWMYDRYAHGDRLPPQSLHRPGDEGVPQVSSPNVRWLCAYSDAQIPRTERFVVALLRDAAEIAREQGVALNVHSYHEAIRMGDEVRLRRVDGTGEVHNSFTPAAIVNATGAWVDDTLAKLQVPSQPLLGGTKGTHFVTFHEGLRAALSGNGIYTEAADGRPIFLLPFGEGVLVGTTDLPFSGDPADAVATEAELAYLLAGVLRVFPNLPLQRNDIALHYCGVRPLPRVATGGPAGITRRHLWHWHETGRLPMVSLIGGKLTTCRAFAERTVTDLLPKLGKMVTATSRARPIAGLADLRELGGPLLPGTTLPLAAVQHAIRNEWATTLDDLVERRLLLHFDRDLSRNTLLSLAQVLVDEQLLSADKIQSEVDRFATRLLQHFGRRLSP